MKLSGFRVIDLSVFLPGPYLTQILADHRAEVIKVERPGEGDPGRHIGLSDGPSMVYFWKLTRGKESVGLNLESAEDRGALLRPSEKLRQPRHPAGSVAGQESPGARHGPDRRARASTSGLAHPLSFRARAPQAPGTAAQRAPRRDPGALRSHDPEE